MSKARVPDEYELDNGDCNPPDDAPFPNPSAPEGGAPGDTSGEQPSEINGNSMISGT